MSKSRYASSRRKCICSGGLTNAEEEDKVKLRTCRLITQQFATINDARGQFLALPSLYDSGEGGEGCASRMRRNADIKRHKLERICHHLGLGVENIDQYASVDNREQRGMSKGQHVVHDGSLDEQSQRKEKQGQRRTRHVAAWHFHPEVVQEMIVGDDSSGGTAGKKKKGAAQKKMSFKDYLSRGFVLRHRLLERGYSPDDAFRFEEEQLEQLGLTLEKTKEKRNKWNGRIYAPVPCYPAERALVDYNLVVTSSRLDSILEECDSFAFGTRHLDGGNDDGDDVDRNGKSEEEGSSAQPQQRNGKRPAAVHPDPPAAAAAAESKRPKMKIDWETGDILDASPLAMAASIAGCSVSEMERRNANAAAAIAAKEAARAERAANKARSAKRDRMAAEMDELRYTVCLLRQRCVALEAELRVTEDEVLEAEGARLAAEEGTGDDNAGEEGKTALYQHHGGLEYDNEQEVQYQRQQHEYNGGGGDEDGLEQYAYRLASSISPLRQQRRRRGW